MSRLSMKVGLGPVSLLILLGGHGALRSGPAEQGGRARRPASTMRERPPMPRFTRPVMFNTPEADRILAALQVFPVDNPWNEDVSQRPLHPNSRNLVGSVGSEKR